MQKLPKSMVEFSFTVSQEEADPFLKAAAERLAQKSSIPGFRPGKAPYDMIKQRVGEMAILEEALEPIVRANYTKAVMKESIDTVGSPEINVEKLAPGNPISFKVKAALIPEIEKLGDYKSKQIERKKVEVEENRVDKTIEDLAKMQTKEKAVDRPATKEDKIVIDMEISQGGVVVEGGQSPNFQVYLSEKNYIPGMTDELVGLKPGEERKFQLKFPEEHFQKNLAGKNVDIKVKANQIFELEPPKIDDEFAKSIGQPDLKSLRELIQANLVKEAEAEQDRHIEHQLFDELIKNSRFGDIPELLVNEEVNKMLHELEHNAAHQGMKFDDYLGAVKKTVADLKMEFTPEAIRRIKAALLMRVISDKENINVTDEEVDKELDRIAENYKDNDEARKQIFSPEYRDYVAGSIQNQKTIQLLKENMIK